MSRYYDKIWKIKYIPNFKWIHSSERLTYETAAMKQRLQADISKGITYKLMLKKSKRMNKNLTTY